MKRSKFRAIHYPLSTAHLPGVVLRMRREYGKKLSKLFCLLSDQRVAISGELLHVKNS